MRQLRHDLTHRILPYNAHYRRLFEEADLNPLDLRTPADLKHLPFTSKADLNGAADGPREFVLIPDEARIKREPGVILHALLHGPTAARHRIEDEFRPLLMTSTTGRSAEPVPFLFTRQDLHRLDLAGHRIMELGGSRPDWRHANLFPFAPHLAFWQTHHAGMAFGAFMVSTGGGKTLGTDGNLRLLEKVRPEILIGMPTFIYHVLRQAVDEGRHWPQLQRIVLGGEKVATGLRARLLDLASHLGSPAASVISTYGFTEAKMAFPECVVEPGSDASGYHLYPDLGLFEIVHPETGDPVPEGTPGEIVFTPLHARGTVVLRYRTGDIAGGGITWDACPHCGRTCPRLHGPISRVSDIRALSLDKVKGTLVNFNVLEHLLDDLLGVAAWQIELCKRNDDPNDVDEIVVRICPESGIDTSRLEQRVRARFAEGTEVAPNAVTFHDLADLRDRLGVGRLLKEEKILDRRVSSGTAVTTLHPSTS